jgi:2-polyprenyl-6-methoxyphenol hydroxylase-like FAD-dependent oxidoreductase
MTDTWTDEVAVDGIVLIGDAAGWSDPTIGQGQSVTFRDVHLVTDALIGNAVWTPDIFSAYREERAERMRRLRLVSEAMYMSSGFGPDARSKRTRLDQLRSSNPNRYAQGLCVLVGPWNTPEEASTDEAMDELLVA